MGAFKSINALKHSPTFQVYKNLPMESMAQISKCPQLPAAFNFEFGPLGDNQHSYFKPVVIQLLEKSKPAKNKKVVGTKLVYPQWNADNLCYTPAFVIPQDKGMFEKIKDTFHESYLDRIKNCLEESTGFSLTPLRPPYPRDQHYCGVCKAAYTTFQDHIASESHLTNCQTSPYTRHIFDFCQIHGYHGKQKNPDSTILKNDSSEKNITDLPVPTRPKPNPQSDSLIIPALRPTKCHLSFSSKLQQQQTSQTTKSSKERITP